MNKIRKQIESDIEDSYVGFGNFRDSIAVDLLTESFKKNSVLFSLFCAENYIHLHSDRWVRYLGDDTEFETEDLFKIWENEK